MNTYFTSDTHFWHKNIIDYCSKSRGQFKTADGQLDINAMNEELIRRWNAVVGPDDVVYHLGDFQMKLKSMDGVQVLNRLLGRKHLIWGNHDLLKGVKDEKTREHWLSRGFETVQDSLKLELDGKKLYLHHEPMPWSEWQDCDIHLCGHVHDAWASAPAGPRRGRIINVGVDVQDLTPKTLAELLWTPGGHSLPPEAFQDGVASES